MNPNKIDLPDFVLTELYKDSLVLVTDTGLNTNALKAPQHSEQFAVINKDPSSPTIKSQESVSFLGSNGKHICIVVNDEQATHLQDDLLDILSAILSACKLNLADVAIVNMYKQDISDAILRKELSPGTTILFGVQTTAIDLPFSIPIYKPQPFNNCTYLQSVSLEKMRGNSTEAKLEKSKLWVSLKNIFGI